MGIEPVNFKKFSTFETLYQANSTVFYGEFHSFSTKIPASDI
jgi:hypothetical protein